jgi:3-deoxy-manno-octulosonate cytidylyltransferase (CMP-KDO synthetase)
VATRPEPARPRGSAPAEPAGATAIIPARLGSTRFPAKVLAAETGRPLVQHVAEAARRAPSVRRVVVAADDARIADALAPFGTEVVLTDAAHTSGTSRLAEAAAILALPAGEVVVNVQGDEPEIEPGVIDAAVGALANPAASAGTVASPFLPGEDPADPNIVKVALRLDGRALLFTRALVPMRRDAACPAPRVLRHVGVYAYRRAYLERFVSLPPAPIEQAEQLEQMRILEHGDEIAVAVVRCAHAGIDTRAQYEAFVRRELASRRG